MLTSIQQSSERNIYDSIPDFEREEGANKASMTMTKI
jgi:hypothetical protein